RIASALPGDYWASSSVPPFGLELRVLRKPRPELAPVLETAAPAELLEILHRHDAHMMLHPVPVARLLPADVGRLVRQVLDVIDGLHDKAAIGERVKPHPFPRHRVPGQRARGAHTTSTKACTPAPDATAPFSAVLEAICKPLRNKT